MMSQKVALDTARGMQEKGELDGIGANAMVVRLMGVRLIIGPLTREVRRELMDAVKLGKLGHIKKKGLRPEAFHHLNARSHALDLREEHFRQATKAIRGVMYTPPTLASFPGTVFVIED